MADNELVRADNVYVKVLGELRKRLGYSKLNTALLEETDAVGVHGLHRYYHQAAGVTTGKMLAGFGRNLYDWDDVPSKITHADTSRGTSGDESFTLNNEWHFATFQNAAYGVNGHDTPIRYGPGATGAYNTCYLRDYGCNNYTAAADTFAATDKGSGTGPSIAQWRWIVTFLTDTSEESAPAISSAGVWIVADLDHTTGQAVSLANIPVGPANYGITNRKIYRAIVDDNGIATTAFRLVATIDVDDTTLDDTVLDADLGAEIPSDNYAGYSIDSRTYDECRHSTGTPARQGPYCVAVHSNRLWFARTDVFPCRVWYSEDGLPNTRYSENWIDVSPFDGDYIVQIASVNNVLVIYKRNSIWVLQGSGPSDFTLRQITSAAGALSARGVVSLGDSILSIGRRGMYSFDGVSFNVMPPKIRDSLESVDSADTSKIAAVYADRRLYVSTNDHNRGQSDYTGTHGCLFTSDEELGGWSRWLNTGTTEGMEFSCFSYWDGSPDAYELYAGDSRSGFVYKLNDTAFDDQPTNNNMYVPVNIQTKSWGFGDAEADKTFRRVWVHCRMTPGMPLYLNYRLDNQNWAVEHMHQVPVDANEDYPGYAVAEFILPLQGSHSRGKMLSLWLADNPKGWTPASSEVLPADFRIYSVIVQFYRHHE
jgi:hypothetical protein